MTLTYVNTSQGAKMPTACALMAGRQGWGGLPQWAVGGYLVSEHLYVPMWLCIYEGRDPGVPATGTLFPPTIFNDVVSLWKLYECEIYVKWGFSLTPMWTDIGFITRKGKRITTEFIQISIPWELCQPFSQQPSEGQVFWSSSSQWAHSVLCHPLSNW